MQTPISVSPGKRSFLILCNLCFILAIAAYLIPGGKNLEYEYSVILGFLFLVFLPPLFFLLRPRAKDVNHQYMGLWQVLGLSFCAALPGQGLYFFNICSCSNLGFLFWFSLNTLPSLVWAICLINFYLFLEKIAFDSRGRIEGESPKTTVLTRFLTKGSPNRLAKIGQKLVSSKFFPYPLHGLMIFSSLLWFAGSLFLLPQKRINSLWYGFLHGPIYDYYIHTDLGVVLFRLSSLFFALGVLSLFWQINIKKFSFRHTLFLLSLSAVLICSWLPANRSGKTVLDHELQGELKGDGFVLRYPATEEMKLKKQEIQNLFHETQFHLNDFKSLYGPIEHPLIWIYVYSSQDEKKILFGANETDVTDVITPSIHLTLDGFPHPTLRHELSHAVLSGDAFFGLGFHPNISLTEGIAEAMAPRDGFLSDEQRVAGLFKMGKVKGIAELFSPLFWLEDGASSYSISGAFIKYLISRFGIQKVFRVYAGENFDKVMATPIDPVILDWETYLFDTYDVESILAYLKTAYTFKGNFNEICTHSKYDLHETYAKKPFISFRKPIDFSPLDYYAWRIAIDKEDKASVIRLGLMKLKEFDTTHDNALVAEARELLKKTVVWPAESLEDIRMALLIADLSEFLGMHEDTVLWQKRIEEMSQKQFLGGSISLELAIREILAETFEREYKSVPKWVFFSGGSKYLKEIFQKDKPDGPSRLWLMSNFPKELPNYIGILAGSTHSSFSEKEMSGRYLHYLEFSMGIKALLREKNYGNVLITIDTHKKYNRFLENDYFQMIYREAEYFKNVSL